MKNFTPLEQHYNKFNEDKRLNSRHGRVEYTISMKYIEEYLAGMDNPRILDVGAGTGRYTIALAEKGYDVSAVELVQHNAGRIKQKAQNKGLNVEVHKGNAMNLKWYKDESFDAVLVFGPMYHLKDFNDRVKALKEAKRVLKKGGVIFVAYIMNEYGVLTYAFKEKNILDCIEKGKLSENYHTIPTEEDLYYFVRIEDMDAFNDAAGLYREKIVAVDGAANYIRPILNSLTEEEFERFIEYQLSVCERMDLMGASGHTVDILRKK